VGVIKFLAPDTGSWDLGQISSTMESTQSSARRPSRLTYKEASGMAATLSMLEDIGALHAALTISAENDKDPAAAGGCGSDHESRPSSQVVLPTSEFKSIHGLDWGECEVSLQSSNYRATTQRFPPLVIFLTFERWRELALSASNSSYSSQHVPTSST